MNILVSGGTGFIGEKLVQLLISKGHVVRVLQRKSKDLPFYWNLDKKEIDEKSFEDLDAIIHLAGAPISKPWTKKYKKELYESRIFTANFLYESCKKFSSFPKVFISASGVAFYGNDLTNKLLTEEDDFGIDFLSQLTVDWEKSANQFLDFGTRVSVLRTPIVLAEKGGILDVLKPIFKLGLGANIGNGKNYMSWIHLDDLISMYDFVLNNPVRGPVNAVADEVVNQNEFNKSLAKSLNKPFFVPNIPASIIKFVLGERSILVLCNGRISNEKIKKYGFTFRYNSLTDALK